MTLDSTQSRVVFVTLLLAAYVSVTVAAAVNQRPRTDEGYFASPALNLVKTGSTGTPILEEGNHMKGIREHTYWVPPLHMLAQAGWYEVFGFSLASMRLLSMAWGLLLLAASYLLVKAISGNVTAALLAAGVVAVDYNFLLCAGSGRMDVMSAALGCSGLAAYLALRERRFGLAMLAGNALVCAAGLTHPVGGYLSFAGIAFLVLYYDWRRLRPASLALGALPYLAGAAGWGWYIMQDPAGFLSQFGTNATMDNRLAGLTSPLAGIYREITGRYFVAFGLGPHSEGNYGPIWVKAVVLLVYIAGVIGAVSNREIRSNKGYRALMYLLGIYFLLLSVLDAQKAYYYLPHVTPFFAALLVIWLRWGLAKQIVPVWFVAGVAVVLVAVGVGGTAFRNRISSYKTSYLPVIQFLNQNVDLERSTVIGSASLGFGLGFPATLTDDARLGYLTGKRPDYLVVSTEYEWVFDDYRKSQPHFYRFIQQRLSNEYTKIYEQGGWRVYRRSSS
jgi:4-amino-4-deoxy-L-arabinose transferase-like glycosyltransferase